jgi:preprotein translocase subunit SecB
MSQDDTAGQAPQSGQAESGPRFRLLAQYVKDLSFESPRPPAELPHAVQMPRINVNVNVNATPLDEAREQFEVELVLGAEARESDKVVFIAELVYAVVLQLENVSEELKAPLTMVEAPRMIFPFARRIIADMVRDGGFPPLMIEPIDFAALFRQHVQSQAGQQEAAD